MTMRLIEQVVIHCSDSRWGCAVEIDRWHKERTPPFRCIGYHYVICNGYMYGVDNTPDFNLDGKIETGRPIEEKGAHCKGYNGNSIGICLIGRDMFTGKQFEALAKVIDDIRKELGYSFRVRTHHELDPKKPCPNINAEHLRAFLRIKE